MTGNSTVRVIKMSDADNMKGGGREWTDLEGHRGGEGCSNGEMVTSRRSPADRARETSAQDCSRYRSYNEEEICTTRNSRHVNGPKSRL